MTLTVLLRGRIPRFDRKRDLYKKSQLNHLRGHVGPSPQGFSPFPRRGRPIRPISQPGNKGHRPRWLDALLSAMTNQRGA
jgi:hypothetical protein